MEEQKKKKIIVFAGPSGVGKSTLCNMLLNEFDDFEFSVSATTRSIRLGEHNGKSYHFLSEKEFQQGIEHDDFVEWEEVYSGRYYGTLRSEVSRIIASGKKTVFDIDVLGALTIKKQFKDECHIVFVRPESKEALVERLKTRGTENEEEIRTRIERFEKELSYQDKFDEILVNKTGDIKQAREQVIAIAKKHFL
jgi:guanylate kinase